MASDQPSVRIIGGKFERYVIVSNSRLECGPLYWDGIKWMKGLRHARLYAHLADVESDLERWKTKK